MGGAPLHTTSTAAGPHVDQAKTGQSAAQKPGKTDGLQNESAQSGESTQSPEASAAEQSGSPAESSPSAAQPGTQATQPGSPAQSDQAAGSNQPADPAQSNPTDPAQSTAPGDLAQSGAPSSPAQSGVPGGPGQSAPSGSPALPGGPGQTGQPLADAGGTVAAVAGGAAMQAAAVQAAAPAAPTTPAGPKAAPTHTRVGGPPPVRQQEPQPDATPMRPVSAKPAYLGTFAEERLTRDAAGRITMIDEAPVAVALRWLAEMRAEQYWNAQRYEDSTRAESQRPAIPFGTPPFQRPNVALNYEYTTNAKGKTVRQNRNRTGNTVAVVINAMTGEVFEAVNGTTPDHEVHDHLKQRREKLDPAGYLQFDNDGNVETNDGEPVRKPTPYPPDLFSHAEVRAVNEGLHRHPGAVPGDFIADVQFMRGEGVRSAPFCMNCDFVLHDVTTNVGRRHYTENGPVNDPGHFHDDPHATVRRPGGPFGPNGPVGPNAPHGPGDQGPTTPQGTDPVGTAPDSRAEPNAPGPQGTTPESQTTPNEAQDAATNSQGTAPNSEGTTPESQSTSNEAQDTAPESSTAPNSQSTSPDSESTPTESQGAAPESQGTPNESQGATTESQSTSPESQGRSDDSGGSARSGSARSSGQPGPDTHPVRAVPHSGFVADPKRAADEFVVRTEARIAMSRVQEDVGVTVRNLGNGRFTVTRADGSRFVVRVMSGDTANGNPAEVVIPKGASPIIRVSSRLDRVHIDRAVASALGQLSARLAGNSVAEDVLTSSHHPGGRAERSAHDEGRQTELRYLDRKLAEKSNQVRLLRRRRITAEMRALVEDMGVHADTAGGKQRYAAANPDTRALLDKHAAPGSRRPSWAKELTGYPAWHSFRHHLAAEVAPGLAASATIAATGAPLPALAVAAMTLGTGIAGTFIKKRYGWNEKQLVDAGHGHFGKVREYEAAQRRKQLLDPLLERTGAAGIDVAANGPAEPAPGDAPPMVQSYGQRFLYRGVPGLVGGAAVATLLPLGLPIWTAAAQWGVAGLAAAFGPYVEGYLRKRIVPMEWKRIDNEFRTADEVAAKFDEEFVAELHKVLDRLERLAGGAPNQTGALAIPVRQNDVTDPGVRHFAANAAPGSLGDVARGLADYGGKVTGAQQEAATKTGQAASDALAKGMDAAADAAALGTTRGLIGTLVSTFLDRNFTRAEYAKILEQVAFDATGTVAEQVQLEHSRLTGLLADVNARLDQAEAAQRVQGSAPSRAAHLALSTPQSTNDPAQRPAGQQDKKAFRKLGIKQAIAMETAAIGASVAFDQGTSWLAIPGLPFTVPATGVVIGAVSTAVALSATLRYLMRRAEQLAVDEKVLADRANARVVEAVQAEERRKFDLEFWTRRIEAAAQAKAAGTPIAEAPAPAPPAVPKALDRRDSAYPDHVQAITAHERESMLRDPRPWSLTNARLDGLRRINVQAERVRDFLARQQQGTLAEPTQLEQAQLDLSNLLAAYQELVKDGTPMPTDDELLTNAKKPGSARSGNGHAPQQKLSGKLRKIYAQSIETPGGRAFHDPNDAGIIRDALELPAQPGMYTVDIHGHPDKVTFLGRPLTEHDLAALIRNDPKWNGQPIWLFSCETGQLDDGFAQRLADELGVAVVAPTEIAVSDEDGNFFVATETGTDAYGEPIYHSPPDGVWRKFVPANQLAPGEVSGEVVDMDPQTGTGSGRTSTPNPGPLPPSGGHYYPDREDVVLAVPQVDLGPDPVRPVHTITARLWPDELVDLVADGGRWTEGEPVRIAIDGTLSEDYLQRTADLLGADVSVTPGVVTDGPANPSSGMLEVFTGTHPDGELRTFRPRVPAATSEETS